MFTQGGDRTEDIVLGNWDDSDRVVGDYSTTSSGDFNFIDSSGGIKNVNLAYDVEATMRQLTLRIEELEKALRGQIRANRIKEAGIEL